MDNSIIQRLLSQLTPEQVAQLMAEPEQAGKGGVNPRLLALMRMTRGGQFSDSAMPERNIMGNANSWRNWQGTRTPMPSTGIANPYRGQRIAPQEALQVPAPEFYVPGAENVRLRGI